MTTQIHECHPHDTKEQLYEVRLHDVQLHDDFLKNCDSSIMATYIMDRTIIDTWTHASWIHLHGSHCLSARNSNLCQSTLAPRILSQLLCEYLLSVNQLSGKIFDIGHLTLGLVLPSSPLKGHDSLAVGSN